jgi:hypothetical protein
MSCLAQLSCFKYSGTTGPGSCDASIIPHGGGGEGEIALLGCILAGRKKIAMSASEPDGTFSLFSETLVHW